MDPKRQEDAHYRLLEMVSSQNPLPKLFQHLEHEESLSLPTTHIKDAILYLLEQKHDWRQIVSYAKKWDRMQWLQGFFCRLRNRIGESSNQAILPEKIDSELDRMVIKWQRGEKEHQEEVERKLISQSIHRPSRRIYVDLAPVKISDFAPLKLTEKTEGIQESRKRQSLRSKEFSETGKISMPRYRESPAPGREADFSFDKSQKDPKAQKDHKEGRPNTIWEGVDTNTLFDFMNIDEVKKALEDINKENQSDDEELAGHKSASEKPIADLEPVPLSSQPEVPGEHRRVSVFGLTPNTARKRRRKSKKVEEENAESEENPSKFADIYMKKAEQKGLKLDKEGRIINPEQSEPEPLPFLTSAEIKDLTSIKDTPDELIFRKLEAQLDKEYGSIDDMMTEFQSFLEKEYVPQKLDDSDDDIPNFTSEYLKVTMKDGKRHVETIRYYNEAYFLWSEDEEEGEPEPASKNQSPPKSMK